MAQKNIEGKVALVTGASSGMGKDFAQALLNEGMTVYVAARRLAQMDDLKALGAIAVKMDITNDSDIKALVETIKADHGGLDLLVNNAGFGIYGAIEDTSIDDARYQFEVNLFGLARLTQLLLPDMRNRKAGTIINISSMGGKVYTPLGAWYHATKYALEGWSDCLRLELKPFGINVVIIEPGVIHTEFGNVMIGPMVKRSGEGAYSAMTMSLAAASEKAFSKGDASPPEVITKLVLKAAKAPRPKTRYVAGKYAAPMIFIRKWFGDRVFDAIVMSQVK